MEEDFSRIINRINLIKESNSVFAQEHSHSLNELVSRLEGVRDTYVSLENLNEKFFQLDPFRLEMDFDPITGVMTMRQNGTVLHSIKLNRADPAVPVQLAGKSDMSSFSPVAQEENAEFKKVKADIASELEKIYYNASKAWDLVEQTLLQKKKSEFINVKMVRNKLIEHTEHGDIFSFGASQEWGPSVKPSQKINRKEKFHDKGIRVNMKEFLDRLKSRLENLPPN